MDSEKLIDGEVEKEVVRQLAILEYGAAEITPREEFINMLRNSIIKKTPLRIKMGIDPTSADIHLGHMVAVKKMRAFQDLGHQAVIIIGDYTAQIGDPTEKSESRPSLTHQETKKNARTYMEQMFTLLDETKTEIHYQSEWFNDVDLKDVMSWAAQTTVAKLISHDTFRKRIDQGQSLGLHELFYPVLQGIDSVFVRADVEIGGTDQKFNVLMGRDYQRNANFRPQAALLVPILIGTDGKEKMSKSLGNYIAVLSDPFDKFGKVMSIPDELMENYFKYVANFTIDEAQSFVSRIKSQELHPNEAKKQLASRVVSMYHGEEQGQLMREQFERVFANKKLPDDILEFAFNRGQNLISILVASGLLDSNGEVRRMVKQNAVSIVDGDKITDAEITIDESYVGKVIKVGKRKFVKLV